jgi:hypothetical protein
MPSYATSLLPSNTGLALGAPNQLWNLWVQFLNGGTPVNSSTSAVAWSATPSFAATTFFSVFTITLFGNVSASTFTSAIPGLVLFQITQDSVGNRTFVWPTQFNAPSNLGIAPNTTTTQLFYYDGTNAWPIATGVSYP